MSFHVEGEAMKKTTNESGKQGYGMMSRLVYRPLRQDGSIFQVGLSGAFETPRYNDDEALNHESFVLKSKFPTRIAKVTAQEAKISDADWLYKFTPEVCAAYGRLGLEAQYFYVNVQRKNVQREFKASGAYAMLRGLLIGKNYKYSESDGDRKSTSLNSSHANISYAVFWLTE